MKKLSVIIGVILFFFTTAIVNAQPGLGLGIPGQGNPGQGGGAGAIQGDNSGQTSHGVEISIPTVAMVDVEGPDGNEAGTINLTPDVSSLEAGSAIDFSTATDQSLWLNYTSIVGSNQDSRNITAEISGSLPNGISLKLSAGSVSSGKGTRGDSAGEISLSGTAKNLVTGIGSGFTESGYQKGHQLTYALDMDDNNYTNLSAGNYEVIVTYTITGN